MKAHPYKPGMVQFGMDLAEDGTLGDIPVCKTCCYPEDHLNHQIPEDAVKLLKELFEVMRLEVEAQRVWMTPERDALMLRCANLLRTTLR